MHKLITCMISGKPKTDIKMRIGESQVKLTKEQKKTISKVVNRYMRMQRNRRVRQLKEWMSLHKN